MSATISKFLDEITEIFLKLIVFVLIFIVVTVSFFWYLVLYITPEAELERDQQGHYIVNIDNYRHWHTYSALLNSSDNSIKLENDVVLRSVATIESSCEGISNCERYASKFYKINENKRNVYIILNKDDDVLSQYINNIHSTVDAHNNSIINYSIKRSLVEPDFPSIFNYKVFKSDDSYDSIHNKKVDFANVNCRNNASGCRVDAIGSFSVFGFPTISFKVK
ncbi:hypothetical protein [Shewanella sp. 4_MG-2023]|uniref:hypothetical protein n=1 Tax=Shewanella sp. 4_MG-2023 TaxID=3062652 RepID=UPI0026E289AA|nr:hypothetical protein [Shewanella sp. 4_MG-2023]MDO6678440.1 hypothetical protein [Shewanella sp. 4_MG-2023]